MTETAKVVTANRLIDGIAVFWTGARWSERFADAEALDAFKALCSVEGIVPALESSHGIAYTMKRAREMTADQIIVGNLSGRGDKDVQEAARVLGDQAV